MLLKIVKKYHLHGIEGGLASTRVVPRRMLNAIRSADQIVAAAESQAQTIVQDAQAHAGAIAFDAARVAQRAFWSSAAQALDELAALQQVFLSELRPRLHQIIEDAFRQLLLDIPAAQKISATLQSVLQTWSGENDAVLRVHPADHAAVQAALPPHLPCRLIADPALAVGSCALSAGGVVLQSAFDSNVDQLLLAIRGAESLH